MVKFGPETKQRLTTLFSLTRFIFQWGFIPAVLYLGFQKGSDQGMPPFTLLSLFMY